MVLNVISIPSSSAYTVVEKKMAQQHTASPAGVEDLRQKTPFLYLDTVAQEGDSRTIQGTVTFDEGEGRFFDPQSVPGVFVLEALAQLSGILLLRVTGTSRGGLLVGLDGVELGDVRSVPVKVHLHVRALGLGEQVSRFMGTANLDGRTWCRARLIIHHSGVSRAAVEGIGL